jgi:peroxiredoxin
MFVAVNAGDTSVQIKKLLSKHPFNFLILEDSSKNISKSLGVTELPRTMIISPSGELIYSDSKPPKNLN